MVGVCHGVDQNHIDIVLECLVELGFIGLSGSPDAFFDGDFYVVFVVGLDYEELGVGEVLRELVFLSVVEGYQVLLRSLLRHHEVRSQLLPDL